MPYSYRQGLKGIPLLQFFPLFCFKGACMSSFLGLSNSNNQFVLLQIMTIVVQLLYLSLGKTITPKQYQKDYLRYQDTRFHLQAIMLFKLPFSVQFSSVAQSCPTLCHPMNCSTPGLPVHHQHPEFTQTHVHRVGDAIQPSHPLSSPSPPALNPSQHQSLFQ